MILDGIGGANTLTGRQFEIQTDLRTSIGDSDNYIVSKRAFKHKNIHEVSSVDKQTGDISLKGHIMQHSALYHFLDNFFGKPSIPLDSNNEALYKYPLACNSLPNLPLDENGSIREYTSFKKILSKSVRPDEAFYSIDENTFYIIEKKKQTTSGSVDEKIRSYRSMMNIYYKLITRSTGVNVKFIYLLSDWFTDARYSDDLENIVFEGGSYFIESLPLSAIGLIEA